MKISNQTPQQILTSKDMKSTPKDKAVDMDVLSVLMNKKDGVSISGEKVDPDVPVMKWHFQLAEPEVSDLTKANGVKGQAENPVSIGIIHTNDEHDPNFEKFPKEATLIHKREAFHGDANSIIVNTGDNTYESFNDKPGPQFYGPVPQIFKSEGMEYYVPGNHEFQFGGKYLEDNILSAVEKEGTNVLLGNVTLKSEGRELEHTKPFSIENINGVNVGIIGLTTPRQKTKAHPTVGFDVKVESVQEAAARIVPEAKKAGAEIIVIIAHEGVNACVNAASSVPGVDVIVAGHDHATLEAPKEVRNVDGRNSLVVEAGSHAEYVGDVTLEVDPKSKKVLSVDYKLFPTQGVAPDPDVTAIVNKYKSGN